MEKNILELINIVNIIILVIIRVWISYVVPLWKLGTVQHTRVWARGPFVCPEPKLTSHCVMSDSPESEPQSQHCIYLRFEVLPLLDQKGQTDGAGVLSFLSPLFRLHVGPPRSDPPMITVHMLTTTEGLPSGCWLCGAGLSGRSRVVKGLWQTISGFRGLCLIGLLHVVTPEMERSVTSAHMTAVASPAFRWPVASTEPTKNEQVHNMSGLVLWLIKLETVN